MDPFIHEQYKKLLPLTREEIEKVITTARAAGYSRFSHFASEEFYTEANTGGTWCVAFSNVKFGFEIVFDELNGLRSYYIDKFIRDPKPSMVSWEVSPDGGVSIGDILSKIEEFKL